MQTNDSKHNVEKRSPASYLAKAKEKMGTKSNVGKRYEKISTFQNGAQLLVALIVAAMILQGAPLYGQSRQLPNPNYYQAFGQFYLAEYQDAGKDFTRGANSAYKQGTQRYLDSICFWTMMAECHYHLGNYADAIPLYEQSLELYLAYQGQQWQSRLQPLPVIQADNSVAARVRITWGTPSRKALIPRMPSTFPVLFGRLDSERAFQEGGVVDNAEIKQIDVNEIMRCAALALHRRRVIKGPTSQYDPFSVRLVNGLNAAGTGNGTLMGAYNGVLLGIAQASMNEWDRAAKTLNNSLQFNGGMDHPLTPVALIELANIGLETQNYAVANTLALEASYSAAVFYQYDLVEEALGLGTTIHLLQSKTAYPPLEFAIVWAGKEKARLMQASLIVKLAECLAESGQTDLAATVLRQINGPINSRNSLGGAVVSARAKYVAALVRFLEADFVGGSADLSAALSAFQTGSLWLYRLGLADQLVVSGNVRERQADLLYGVLLHDPSDLDWRMDPLEAIAFLASNHVGPMERWFDIVVERKDMDRAINIAELQSDLAYPRRIVELGPLDQPVVRDPPVPFLERYPQLEPRQMRAQTSVRPTTERQMTVHLAVGASLVSIGTELRRVGIGSAHHDHDRVARLHGDAVHHVRLLDDSKYLHDGRVQSQQFLDDLRDRGRIGHDRVPHRFVLSEMRQHAVER